MTSPVIALPESLGEYRFLYCHGKIREGYESKLRLHFPEDVALTVGRQRTICKEVGALPGVKTARIDKTDERFMLVVEFDYRAAPEEVTAVSELLIARCDLAGGASARAEVVRDTNGRHIGTLVKLNFLDGLPDAFDEESFKQTAGPERVDRFDVDGVAIMYSMATPTQDKQVITEQARQVAEALGIYLIGEVEVENDPKLRLLWALDYAGSPA